MLKKLEKEYLIRSYECDKNGALRLVTMMNIFQDMADNHAAAMGLGLDFCLARGLAWVGANYHIQIERLPQLHEKIIVRTWPAVEKKLGAVRDFAVFDENGKNIIKASSQWILIDFHKKRPVSLRDNLPEYPVITERAVETDFPKIADIAGIDCQMNFNVRFDDIDFNNHVNNAVYPLWASEAVGTEFRSSHTPAEIEVMFKKECRLGEKVIVETELNGLISLHSVRSQTDNRELARLKITWKI
ncbi:MAG: thioesterase [Alphaproteobacteria bacterium]|nr:thioesterase [Alphaproteobacteria bacterium]